MIEVKRWWLGRRIVGLHVLMEESPELTADFGDYLKAISNPNRERKMIDAGIVEDIDWWDMDVYTKDGWVGGPAYITFWTFIQALFAKPIYERKPWKEL